MSQDRDTKFLGSVRQLSRKLEAYVGRDADMIAIETLIAQYAYDLVWYALLNVDTFELGYHPVDEYKQSIMSTVPDLTQWPESSTE